MLLQESGSDRSDDPQAAASHPENPAMTANPEEKQRERPCLGPRRIALETLGTVLATQKQAQEVLEAKLSRLHLGEEDRALARELVSGCVRRLATLDAVLGAYLARPVDSLADSVRHLLRIGIYQLLFLDRIPPHAAVNETVALAAAIHQPAARGLVNAVMRQILREVEVRASAEGVAPRRAVPIRPGRWCVFARDILPAPEADRIAWLAAAYSFPAWLVQRWVARFGEEEARRLFIIANEAAPLFLRPRQGRADVASLMTRLAAAGVVATISPSGRTVRLDTRVNVAQLDVLREGLCLVQDDSAAAVVPALDLAPGHQALDLCAAPGGKACQMAEAVGEGGRVVAVDVNASRLQRLRENMERLGLYNIAIVVADATKLEPALFHGKFDCVLVDVPCTNTGVLRRRVEARWRIQPADLQSLPVLQLALAKSGALALRPGGIMAYSTCSLEPEENEVVVRALLAAFPGLVLEREERILPALDGGDGVYFACLRLGGQ